MSQETLCRLCISACSKFKHLVDDSGQFNEVYEMAVKYFDPMLLNPVNGDNNIIICIECWQHIRDFYSFQQAVIQNHSQLKSLELTLRTEKLTNPVEQSPTIKSEMTISKNSVTILDIVEIPNAATSEATPDTDYDMMIKDQSIVLQLPSNVEPSTSLDEVCERNQQETTALNADSDKCVSKLNCDVCHHTFSDYHLLLEHYHVDHDSIDNNKEIYNNETDHMGSSSFVEISDDEADHDDLSYVDQIEYNSCVEISDDDQNDNTTIEIDDELKNNDEYILHQRSFDISNQNLESIHAKIKSKGLNAFEIRQLKYDKYIEKWKSDLECPLCKLIFKKYSNYSLHFKNEHPSHRCFIFCCQRKLVSRYRLVEHISLHINPNRFKCCICASNLSSKSSLKRHFLLLHTNQVTRDEIELLFREEVIYNTHDKLISDVQNISNIDITLERIAVLLQKKAMQTVVPTTIDSMLRNDPSPNEPSIINSASAVSTGCIFPSEEQHVEPAKLLPEQATVQTVYNAKRLFMCIQCNASFSNNSNLKKHKKYHKNNKILTGGEHNNLGLDNILENNVEQLNVTSYQSYPHAIDKHNFVLDQSNTISIYPLYNEIESNNDEESIVTSIASENEAKGNEIISEAQVNNENSIDDSDIVFNEIRMPALDIVDIKEETPLNFYNEYANNNSIINDENYIQSLCTEHNNLEEDDMVIDLVDESSSSSYSSQNLI